MDLNWPMWVSVSVSVLACQGGSAGDGGGSMGATGSVTAGDEGQPMADAGSSADGTGAEAGGSERYHPQGFAAADVHGLAAKLNTENCLTCHGDDLKGDWTNVSCDGCHKEGWRTDCEYCHGGDEPTQGAPPRDIDGSSLLEESSFRVHTAHVTETNHPVFACSMCHVQPDNVLSPGHLWDDTPAYAEVDFSGGLSPDGLWAAGTCGNLYCHGNGNGGVGGIDHADPKPTCSQCHADETTPVGWLGMSGEHGKHLLASITCADCHPATTSGPGEILDPILHVDGVVEVAIVDPAVTYDAANVTCTGICHAQAHFTDGW